MGGSLRRSKRHRPKVTRCVKRKKLAKTQLPEEIKAERPDLKKKLAMDPEWNTLRNYGDNYVAAGFVGDPNCGHGRNQHAAGGGSGSGGAPGMEVEQFSDHDDVEPEDDDFRATLGLERLAGKKPPAKLTTQQQRVVAALVEAHGDDVQAMVKDRKLNKMLLPASKLDKMLDAYHYQGSAHNFRAPMKHNRHH